MDKLNSTYQKRRQLAQFFSDKEVVDLIFKEFEIDFNNKTIVEPSCGEGSFIDAINAKTQKYNKIIAIDIDNNVLKKVNVEGKIELINDNFLNHRFIDEIDMIIGNPPFTLKVPGYADTTHAFISKSIDTVKENGEIILILPNTLLRSQKYQEAREKILRETKIVAILDTTSYDFLGADVETIALYLIKKSTKEQEYYYINSSYKNRVKLKVNSRKSILLSNTDTFNSIESKLSNNTLEDLFEIRRGNLKGLGLRGRSIDFYGDLLDLDGNDCFIALQNVAYRIAANAVKGSIDNVSDTITMLIPRKEMDIEQLVFITHYLNSSIAYHQLHSNALNNCRLSVHIDRYYISDIRIPNYTKTDIINAQMYLNNSLKQSELQNNRNQFFYEYLKLDDTIIKDIEDLWVPPRFSKKV